MRHAHEVELKMCSVLALHLNRDPFSPTRPSLTHTLTLPPPWCPLSSRSLPLSPSRLPPSSILRPPPPPPPPLPRPGSIDLLPRPTRSFPPPCARCGTPGLLLRCKIHHFKYKTPRFLIRSSTFVVQNSSFFNAKFIIFTHSTVSAPNSSPPKAAETRASWSASPAIFPAAAAATPAPPTIDPSDVSSTTVGPHSEPDSR